MMKFVAMIAAGCGLALALGGAAAAQNMSLRAPAWAQALLAADVTPTTGGRAALAAEGVDVAVRVTLAPTRGGVARVIRYEARGEAGSIALRRFTGHPATGWWLWGPDAPRVTPATAAARQEIAGLLRTAMGVSAALGGNETVGVCASGEQAFVELALAGRSLSATRACVAGADAMGRLALRLSELAGSRTEEELAAAAVAELLEADRAFAAMAAADGVPAAFVHFAAHDALIVTSRAVSEGGDAVTARFSNWLAGERLEWAPRTARVAARGDMGWTWGDSTYIAPDGTRTPGRYVTVWTRDFDGDWRYAFHAPID